VTRFSGFRPTVRRFQNLLEESIHVNKLIFFLTNLNLLVSSLGRLLSIPSYLNFWHLKTYGIVSFFERRELLCSGSTTYV
jgi:hypothetical protein